MRPIPSIPSFALVGQPNEGKTTVMATLAEDDRAAISPVPGTTRSSRRYPVIVDGSEILVFFDTPGFENPAAALGWFEKNKELPDPLQAFISAFAGSPDFKQEKEIFQPLSQGAAAIYVADASRPIRQVDRQEVEILRLAGVRRIGVINSKEGRGQYLNDWKELMARDFNHIHEFNGHQATFRDRLRLLEAARAVIQEWEGPMNRSIQALRDDWEGRLREVSGLIIDNLRSLVLLRERATIQHPGDEKRASEEAGARLKEAVRDLERNFRKKIRRVFHHSDERWLMNDLLDYDLFSTEAWKLLGLDRWQIAAAGAAIGAVAGFVIDAHAAFTTAFSVTATFAAAGAVVAWLGADQAVDVKMPEWKFGPFSMGGGKLGGRQAEASIAPKSNMLWILLDRYLLYVQLCASWAHGRREENPAPAGENADKIGFTTNWRKSGRDKVTTFIGHTLAKRRNPEKLDAAERELRELLLSELHAMTLG